MHTGHPFSLVLVGFGATAVAIAEEIPTVAVVGLVLGLVGVVWDWRRFDDDLPGQRIASSIVGCLVGITVLVLAVAYEPWWSLAVVSFLGYLVTRIVLEVRRINRDLTP